MDRRRDDNYGVTVDVIGQTKVTGQNFLTDSLATSVLNRQLEKQLDPGIAKFLPDRLHFSRSNMVGHKAPRRDIPYSDVKQVYTFPTKPELFMLCIDGDFPGGRIYQSFRCHGAKDLVTIKSMIQGETTDARRTYLPVANLLYAVEPQYNYVNQAPRTPSPVYVERTVRERTPSPVYVRRVRAIPEQQPQPPPPPPQQTVYSRPVYMTETTPEPVILRRVQKQETIPERAPTVYSQLEPSPGIVRRSSIIRPASIVYVEDAPVHDDPGSLVLRRRTRVPPTN